MPIKRLTVLSVMAAAVFASAPLLADPVAVTDSSAVANMRPALLKSILPAFTPAPMLAQSAMPSLAAPAAKPAPGGRLLATAKKSTAAAPLQLAGPEAVSLADDEDDGDEAMPEAGDETAVLTTTGDSGLQKALIGLAMKLRHIRYTSGGHSPSTGFDCSGFVRYVFAHAIGVALPSNSASQFLAGLKVKRTDMQPGDLVFFRTAGRRGQGRISHVGIYVADGKFIHSPSRGKSVRVDNLGNSYWAKRFAGAKRPEGLAQNG